MTLISLGAYGQQHDASRQAASKWRDCGALVMVGDQVDVERSDALMQQFGKGRFRVKGHGGRRSAGKRGVPDRPGIGMPAKPPREGGQAQAQAQADPWADWHRPGNPNTMAAAIEQWLRTGDLNDLTEALDLVAFSDWDEACRAAGWAAWPATVASTIASELGIPGEADRLREILDRLVRERLAAIDFDDAELADPRLVPR